MMKCTVLLAVLFIVSAVTVANDPSHGIPWPVGSLELMDEAKPLMNGYGDRCNGRDKFHTGIDIDDCTEPDSGNRVRCVEDGFIAKMWDQGESSGWSVIVTPTPESQYGWCYTHLENPSEEWEEDEEIYEGDLIDTMNVHGAMETHLHFSWINRNEIETSLVNPLDYLVNEPEGSDYWEFNPDELTPEFKHMFLPEYWAYEWPTQYPNTDSVEADIIPDDDLSGDVDFFFGVTLQAGDISTDEKIYVDCVPERVYWELIRETESGSDVLSTNYVVNFDCALTNDDETAKMFTFYWLMFNLFGGNKAGFMCLTNCGEIQGWESLGIGNIKENSWVTDKHYNQMPVAPTINPVLAEYPDGSYSIDVTCFAHVNDVVPTPNPEVTFDVSIPCELHNFSPALRKVSILDAATDQTYYHAKWVPNDLSADLNVSVDNPASAEAELQVILIFTEEMNTSSLSAILGPLSVGNGVWSGTVVSNDTWTGEVTLPSDEGDGTYILFVSASDIDGMGLMDPEGAGTVPGPSYDTHHELSLNFETQLEWTTILSDKVNGSPVLGDIDGDGDLDISVLCADGLLYILDDDGSVMYNEFWPVDDGEWNEYLTTLTSSPALADIDGNGFLDIVGAHVLGCLAIDAASGEELNGWPCYPSISTIPAKFPGKSSPTVADVDGDGDLEVILTRHLTVPEITTLETSVFLIDHNGNCLWERNLEPSFGGASVLSTPAVGDVSSLHTGNEIVVCTAEGYQAGKESFDEKDFNSAVYLLDPGDGSNVVPPAYYTCWFWASPVVADIDDDGENEIIVGTGISGSSSRRVIVLDGNTLNEEHVWNVGSMVRYPVAIGDINDDGILDIVAVDNSGEVNCWSGNDYQSLPGFPVTVEGIPAAPSIADIDGDLELEIVVGTSSDSLSLYAINSDGTICSGYPVACGNGICGQIAIGNIDDDNSLEMIFADDSESLLYCYDLGAGTFPAAMPWRQFQHDSRHTGCFDADNTIPEPPRKLLGEITYNGGSCDVELEWKFLSVNDPYSSTPQEPTDVIWYGIIRCFPWGPFVLIGRVHAGTNSYVDHFIANPGCPWVIYWVFASDGTNESKLNNPVGFPTSPSDAISLGCSVVEEFSAERVSTGIPQASEMQASEMQASGTRITEESSHAGRISAHERTLEAIPTVRDYAVLSRGNPGCLTDGSVEVCYSPSHGADAVVIDLGEECTVISIMPERMPDISHAEIADMDESVRTLETTRILEPVLSIEVAGSDREFYQFSPESRISIADSRSSADAVRYIRIRGASGLSEISVYGVRETENAVSSVEITRCAEERGWMFAIPVMEYSEEAEVQIYDVSGRMIWSGHAESGSVLHWNGFTENGTPVPNGVYLYQCSIGSDVSNGSFVVRRD